MTRSQPVAAIARLLAEPHRFGFFQAVRLLNRWFARQSPSHGPAAKRVQFRNTLALGFPASEIAEFKVVDRVGAESTTSRSALEGPLESLPPAERIDRVEITPAFMSLLGSGGALPTFYTELLGERETYHRDTAARAFLDIFQHRAVTLFYQAWCKHRLPVQYEGDQRQQFLPLVLAVAGVGQDALRERLQGERGGVSDDTLAHFAGLLQRRPVSAQMVGQIVADYFAEPAQVEQFVGRWFQLPAASRSGLGLANATLGADAVVGDHVWQRDLRLRLTIGPMRREKLRRFLPGGTGALALHHLLSVLTGVTLEYEVRLALRADEVRGIALAEGSAGANLGWDSFLVTRPATHDRDDAAYDLHALQ